MFVSVQCVLFVLVFVSIQCVLFLLVFVSIQCVLVKCHFRTNLGQPEGRLSKARTARLCLDCRDAIQQQNSR